MAKTIERLRNGSTVGRVGLGAYGEGVGTVKQQVYDGDTITVRALGNFGVRFLGIDTPEMNIPLPGEGLFTSLADGRWDTFLSDPFTAGGPLSPSPFSAELTTYLQAKAQAGAGGNHRRHAEGAEDALESFVDADIGVMGVSRDAFSFYLRFAFEIMDRYGRFLCYVNRDQPEEDVPSPRPLSYNERMLEVGLALPYFIWPNINPWRAFGSVLQAVPAPGTAGTLADTDSKLKAARACVAAARDGGIGVFDREDPLVWEPFEVRYLSRKAPPDRWVIDLSKNDDLLIHPERYYTVPNVEDRLFVAAEHVPLFVGAGWRK